MPSWEKGLEVPEHLTVKVGFQANGIVVYGWACTTGRAPQADDFYVGRCKRSEASAAMYRLFELLDGFADGGAEEACARWDEARRKAREHDKDLEASPELF